MRTFTLMGSAPTGSLASATASGHLNMQPSTLENLSHNIESQQEIFAMMRVAAMQAAKRVDLLVPWYSAAPTVNTFCDFELDKQVWRLKATVLVESESGSPLQTAALAAVSAALLCFYETFYQIDPSLSIANIRMENAHDGSGGSIDYSLRVQDINLDF